MVCHDPCCIRCEDTSLNLISLFAGLAGLIGLAQTAGQARIPARQALSPPSPPRFVPAQGRHSFKVW